MFEDITFNENIKGWIKITGEEDQKFWNDIEIPVLAEGVLMSRERMFFNLYLFCVDQIPFQTALYFTYIAMTQTFHYNLFSWYLAFISSKFKG